MNEYDKYRQAVEDQTILPRTSTLRRKLTEKRARERTDQRGKDDVGITPPIPGIPVEESAEPLPLPPFQTIFTTLDLSVEYEDQLPKKFRSTPEDIYVPGELPPGLVRAGFVSLASNVDSETYETIMADERTEKYRVEIDGIIYIQDIHLPVAVAITTGTKIPPIKKVARSININIENANDIWTMNPVLAEQGYRPANEFLNKSDRQILRRNATYDPIYIIDNGRIVMRPSDADSFQLLREKVRDENRRRLRKRNKTRQKDDIDSESRRRAEASIPPQLASQGYRLWVNFLDKRELDEVRSDKIYDGFVIESDGMWLIKEADVDDFRKLRNSLELEQQEKFKDRFERAISNLSEILTPEQLQYLEEANADLTNEQIAEKHSVTLNRVMSQISIGRRRIEILRFAPMGIDSVASYGKATLRRAAYDGVLEHRKYARRPYTTYLIVHKYKQRQRIVNPDMPAKGLVPLSTLRDAGVITLGEFTRFTTNKRFSEFRIKDGNILYVDPLQIPKMREMKGWAQEVINDGQIEIIYHDNQAFR